MIIHSVCAIIKKTEVLNVKITMTMRVADLLAPDYCCNCLKIGHILCPRCIEYIVSEPFGRCLACSRPTAKSSLCSNCRRLADDAWVVGERIGALQKLVDVSKFESNRRGCVVQAKLLDYILPRLPHETVIVPIPTTRKHIRQRGYGHMELVARRLSHLRGYKVMNALHRRTDTVQHGADKETRKRQAKDAFGLRVSKISSPVLIIDDVYTTGSTIKAAARLIKKVSRKPVYVAVTTKQMLD
jgi:ComF family protein